VEEIMKIGAAVLNQAGAVLPYSISKPLSIEEIEIDPPGHGEVLVKMGSAGLCHSDLSAINGARPRPTPMVIGHEAAGTVEEVGPCVGDLKRGDHVVLTFIPSCGQCLHCAAGRPALCEPAAAANAAGTLLSGSRRLHRNGTAIHHHLGCSAFADFATVSRRSLVKIDPELSFEEAALFGCAVLTGVGAVLNTARVTAGSTVAVVGLGGVGLCSILGAVVAGARRIVAVDLLEHKLDVAMSLGATDAFNASDSDCVRQIRSATNGGVEFAFELAGSVKAMELACMITGRGGTTVTAGLPPTADTISIPHGSLVVEERSIKGSYFGSCVPVRDLPRYVALYREGRLPVNKLVTGKLKLEEINIGFDQLQQGTAIRQIILF
jgi:Zn-dependent alcohol dehydrogenase